MGAAAFGKYRLIAELGHGGMADVFLAVQAGPAGSGFRKLTVVKRLRQNLAEEPEFVAMLVDEARIAARLNHPNVVQTNEVGQVGQHYFIAMEYLDGQPFHRIQHRSTQRAKDGSAAPVDREQQYIVVMDALAGLHHAHELCDFDGSPLQIVHRDMTPHNIFVTYDGQVKVVDFGIAKAAGRASETRQGVVKGKVRYMAPEQAIGHALDRRADVFSMGVILWEIATSRRMWKDKDDLQIVHELVASQVPTSPRSVDPSVPEGIDRICQRALAPRAEDRYANAEEFRADIEQFLAEAGSLVDARRRLARSVSELFADKRSEIRTVIEKQLSALDEKASGEFEAIKIPIETQSGPHPVAAVASNPPDAMTTTGLSGQETEIYNPQRRRGASFATRLLAVATVVTFVAVGAMLARRAENPTPTAAAADHQTTAAEPVTVQVRFNARPVTARISIDNGPAIPVPVDIRVPKDDREHNLRIEAEGHATRIETVRFLENVSMSFDLPAMPQPASDSVASSVTMRDRRRPQVVTIIKSAQPKTEPAPPPAANPTPPPAAPPPQPDPKGVKTRPKLDEGDPWAK